MIVVDGALKIIPSGIGFDVGELQVGDKSQPAIIQTLVSDDGQVQVVFPLHIIDQVIDGLQKTKDKAEEEPKNPDLLIPGNQQEAQEMIKQGEGIEKLKG